VNTEQLRQSLKRRWLEYYEKNREWLTHLAVWVDCDGERRPSSGFILGTLSALEPNLTHLLPLIVDLSNNPDRIVMALGLNFSPDELLKQAAQPAGQDESPDSERIKLLPASVAEPVLHKLEERDQRVAMDEACEGAWGQSSEGERPPDYRHRRR